MTVSHTLRRGDSAALAWRPLTRAPLTYRVSRICAARLESTGLQALPEGQSDLMRGVGFVADWETFVEFATGSSRRPGG